MENRTIFIGADGLPRYVPNDLTVNDLINQQSQNWPLVNPIVAPQADEPVRQASITQQPSESNSSVEQKPTPTVYAAIQWVSQNELLIVRSGPNRADSTRYSLAAMIGPPMIQDGVPGNDEFIDGSNKPYCVHGAFNGVKPGRYRLMLTVAGVAFMTLLDLPAGPQTMELLLSNDNEGPQVANTADLFKIEGLFDVGSNNLPA